jgi:hypothetical protein
LVLLLLPPLSLSLAEGAVGLLLLLLLTLRLPGLAELSTMRCTATSKLSDSSSRVSNTTSMRLLLLLSLPRGAASLPTAAAGAAAPAPALVLRLPGLAVFSTMRCTATSKVSDSSSKVPKTTSMCLLPPLLPAAAADTALLPLLALIASAVLA